MLERGTNPSHAVGGAVPARRSSDTGTRRHVQRVGEQTRALPMKSSGAHRLGEVNWMPECCEAFWRECVRRRLKSTPVAERWHPCGEELRRGPSAPPLISLISASGLHALEAKSWTRDLTRGTQPGPASNPAERWSRSCSRPEGYKLQGDANSSPSGTRDLG